MRSFALLITSASLVGCLDDGVDGFYKSETIESLSCNGASSGSSPDFGFFRVSGGDFEGCSDEAGQQCGKIVDIHSIGVLWAGASYSAHQSRSFCILSSTRFVLGVEDGHLIVEETRSMTEGESGACTTAQAEQFATSMSCTGKHRTTAARVR